MNKLLAKSIVLLTIFLYGCSTPIKKIDITEANSYVCYLSEMPVPVESCDEETIRAAMKSKLSLELLYFNNWQWTEGSRSGVAMKGNLVIKTLMSPTELAKGEKDVTEVIPMLYYAGVGNEPDFLTLRNKRSTCEFFINIKKDLNNVRDREWAPRSYRYMGPGDNFLCAAEAERWKFNVFYRKIIEKLPSK